MSDDKYHVFAQAAVLPPQPAVITLFSEDVDPNIPIPSVMGGISIIDDGSILQTVTTIMSPDGVHLYGWSLSLGVPGAKEVSPYFFDTTDLSTVRKTEIPNMGVYFLAKVDASLVTKDADQELLDQVFAYVLPHIRDDGPPPSADA